MRQVNGVASYVMNYYRRLIKNDNISIDFLIVSDVGSPYYDEIKKNNGNVYFLPSYKSKLLAIPKYLNELFKKNQYDIVHCNVINSASIILFYAKKYNVNVRILHSHATQNGDNLIKQFRNFVLKKISIRYSNKYFSCSDLAGKGIFGRKKYYVINNAVDIDRYKYNGKIRNEIRAKNNAKNKFIIMTVGRLTKQKNPFFIIDIIEGLVSKNFEFEFWWIGNGELEEQIKKIVNEKKLNNYVKFFGAISNVSEFYSAADIFILPSLYEGLPVVGIEAQISALPVILSDTITEETKISSNVIFLPIKDSKKWCDTIFEIYNNNQIDRQIFNSDIDKYNIEKQAVKMNNIYLDLLNKKK